MVQNLKRLSFIPLFLLLIAMCWILDAYIPNEGRRAFLEAFVVSGALFSSIFTLIAGLSFGNKEGNTKKKKALLISLFSFVALLTTALPIFELIFFNDPQMRLLYHNEQLTLLAIEFLLITLGAVLSYFAYPLISSWLFRKLKKSYK